MHLVCTLLIKTGESLKITVKLGQKSCRPKVPRIFKIFVPNFAPNFSRIFRGFFVLRFVGNGDQKKFTKNPRHFSMQNSQANTKRIFTTFFWRAGKVTFFFPSSFWRPLLTFTDSAPLAAPLCTYAWEEFSENLRLAYWNKSSQQYDPPHKDMGQSVTRKRGYN